MKKRGNNWLWVIITGLLLFSTSYFPHLLEKSKLALHSLAIGHALFGIGLGLVFDGIARKFGGVSLLTLSVKKYKYIIHFIIVGAVAGILLDGICQWVGKLWYYPFFDNLFYAIVFIAGFAGYFFVIFESYSGMKAIFDHFFPFKKEMKSYNFEKKFYLSIIIIGIFSLLVGFYFSFFNYMLLGKYTFSITKEFPLNLPFWSILLIFLGIWFSLEYAEYKKRERSLLKDIFSGYLNPLWAIILGSLLLAFLMETQNIGLNLWIYQNFPFPEINILGLPVFMLISWPLHYIAFLSLYRVLFEEDTRKEKVFGKKV